MNFIHKNELIHRDLKIENIMVNSVFESNLVDFGLARFNEINSQPNINERSWNTELHVTRNDQIKKYMTTNKRFIHLVLFYIIYSMAD